MDKEKDLLTKRMGAKVKTPLHMAATFNRYQLMDTYKIKAFSLV